MVYFSFLYLIIFLIFSKPNKIYLVIQFTIYFFNRKGFKSIAWRKTIKYKYDCVGLVMNHLKKMRMWGLQMCSRVSTFEAYHWVTTWGLVGSFKKYEWVGLKIKILLHHSTIMGLLLYIQQGKKLIDGNYEPK